MREIEFQVSGMRCGGCAAGLKRKLEQNSGLEAVSVNYATGRLRATVCAAEITDHDILTWVEKAGYGLENPHETTQESVWSFANLEFAFALIASIYCMTPMVFAMVGTDFLNQHWVFGGWSQACIAGIVQFGIGRAFISGAIRSLLSRIWTMDLLVFVGTSAAYGLSLVNLMSGNGAGLYFETAVIIISFLLLGRELEARARKEAFRAINHLRDLLPVEVMVKSGAEFVPQAVKDLQLAQIMRITQGEYVPADGRIIAGEAHLDEAILTGESLPILRKKGAVIHAGTLVSAGLIEAEVVAVGENARIGQIGALIDAAHNSTPPYQRLTDKISTVFVPLILALAVLTFVGWWLVSGTWQQAGLTAISVLVIACPCALGLAVPITIMHGLSVASRHGILVRDFAAMERASLIDRIVFDKTGTLTQAKPEVQAEKWFAGANSTYSKAILSNLAALSTHPYAMALARHLQQDPMISSAKFAVKLDQISTQAGAGIATLHAGKEWKLGKLDFINPAVIPEDLPPNAQDLSLLYFASNGQILACFALWDPPREKADQLINSLTAKGYDIWLLSGDRQEAVRALAQKLAIKNWQGQVSPEDKMHIIDRFQNQEGSKVLMVGDGVNDGPALASAFIGMGVAGGTDLARQASDVVLLQQGLTHILDFLSIAKHTRRKVKQNLGWAFLYNILAIPLAVMGLLNPAIAGIIMALSSLSVVANATLLRLWKPNSL